jgi:ABC-2 type transport system ATP-binding protein
VSDRSGPAVHVEDLAVRRGGHTVVSGLSFDIERGSIVGLLGPSGCGKSTVMRALVGVQREVAGTCEVLGLPAGSPALRTRVGYMTQEASVYRDLSVEENLRYFAAVLGVGGDRIAQVAADVDLLGERARIVGSLSGGQISRVSLAVALIGAPDLLVLDEPTVGLDPVLRRDLWAEFRRLAADGATLLVSSHVMDEAKECDRLLMMRDGRLLAIGPEEEILQRTGTTDLTQAFLAMIEADDG